MIAWQKNPGGKRYTARHQGFELMLVRQNTAAGAAPWRATARDSYVTRRIIDTRYLSDAKKAVETFVAAH